MTTYAPVAATSLCDECTTASANLVGIADLEAHMVKTDAWGFRECNDMVVAVLSHAGERYNIPRTVGESHAQAFSNELYARHDIGRET